MLMWAMSDRAIPRSLAHDGGLRHPHLPLVNAEGKASFVKFHWRPKLGIQSTMWDEAVKMQAPITTIIAATCSRRSTPATFPEWELGIQVFDQEFAEAQAL